MNNATREGVAPSQKIRLYIQYLDQSNNFVDPSSYPTLTIINPTNNIVVIANKQSGVHKDHHEQENTYWDHEEFRDCRVERESCGRFYYDYTIPMNAPLGVWKDVWSVSANGVPLSTTLNFNVDMMTNATEGQPGQEIDPSLSECGIKNVLLLMKLLRIRLGSDGKRRKRDQFGKYLLDANGNYIMEPCNVFSTEELYEFLRAALAEFNSIPHFTWFRFDDEWFVHTFQHQITEGAWIIALARQTILEMGRQYTFSDDGLSYTPPQISETLKGLHTEYLAAYRERLKLIKLQFKPSPRSFSGFPSMGGGVNPAVRRLRHLRERQIF